LDTENEIREHIKKVQLKLMHFCYILMERGTNHDKSKLEFPELEGFKEMDKEPPFPYGSQEYKEKKSRYSWLFEHHYKKNRHHPDAWTDNYTFPFCPDLVDLVEFLCDNISYKEDMSYCEAKKLIEIQTKRYGFSEELSDILQNTLINFYINIGKCYNNAEKEENFLDVVWNLKI